MNAPRRKRVSILLAQLHTIAEELETLAEEEQTAWENIPAAFVDRQESVGECVDTLNEAAPPAHPLRRDSCSLGYGRTCTARL